MCAALYPYVWLGEVRQAIELHVGGSQDLDKDVAMYAAMCGLEADDEWEGCKSLPFANCKLYIMQAPSSAPMMVVEVRDMKAEVARLREKGFSVMDPFPVQAGLFSFVQDKHERQHGLLQQGMDSLLWENNPMVAYREDGQFEPQEISPHPGTWIAMSDPATDVRPLTFNTNAGPVALQQYGNIAEEAFSISGASEVIRGEFGGKMSATQYQGTQASALARIWEPTANLEEELIVPTYEICQKLVMQFFRHDMLIKIGGEGAVRHVWVYPDEAVTGFRVEGIGAVQIAQARESAREMLAQMSVFSKRAGRCGSGCRSA